MYNYSEFKTELVKWLATDPLLQTDIRTYCYFYKMLIVNFRCKNAMSFIVDSVSHLASCKFLIII